ncbi:MAG: hypothetical protein AAF804_22320, partial [Bacteroidota bacterium]
YYWVRMQIEALRMIYAQKDEPADLFSHGIERQIDVDRLLHPDILSEFPLLQLYLAFYDAIRNPHPSHQRLAQSFVDYQDQIEPSYQKNFFRLILNFLLRVTWSESRPDLYPAITTYIQESFEQGYGKVDGYVNYHLLTLLVKSYYFQEEIGKGDRAWQRYLPMVPQENQKKTQNYLELLQAYFKQDWPSFDLAWERMELKQYSLARILDCQFMAAQAYLSQAHISKFDNQLRRIRSTLASARFKVQVYQQVFELRLERLRELSKLSPNQVSEFLNKLQQRPLPYASTVFLVNHAKALR